MNYVRGFTKQYKEIRVGTDWRLTLLSIFFLVIMVLLLGRLFLLQIVRYNKYISLASAQNLSYREYEPLRGEVFIQENAEGGLVAVAENRTFWEVYAVPQQINNPSDVAGQLAPLLGLDETEEIVLKERLSKWNDPYEPIQDKVSDTVKESIDSLSIKGVYARERIYRYYPQRESLGHITGFLGYQDDELAGRYGIEGYFQDLLRGNVGFSEFSKAAGGQEINMIGSNYKEVKDGASLVLTLNSVVQFKVCSLLKDAVSWSGAEGGTVILMESASGKIRAMCSEPSFDPNEYYSVDNISVYNNSALFDAYEPGSVFKSITMAAALNEGIVTPDTIYIDEGEVKVDEYTLRNSDGKAHGEVNMTTILTKSLNTGAVYIVQKVGRSTFKKYVEAFGFGKDTGIELSGEVSGNIGSLDDKDASSLATASYGQGLTATPIQLVSAYNAIARRGSYIRPSIAEKIIYADGFEQQIPLPESRQILTPREAQLLTSMLVTVIEDGHAQASKVEGYVLAGKTGTAQIAKTDGKGYEENSFNHTVIGYGPVENPFFTLFVKLDKPTSYIYAEGTASPLFGQIAKFILQYYNIAPSN